MPKLTTNASSRGGRASLVVSKDEGYRVRQLEEAAHRPREERRIDLNMVDHEQIRRNMGVYGD